MIKALQKRTQITLIKMMAKTVPSQKLIHLQLVNKIKYCKFNKLQFNILIKVIVNNIYK